MSRIIAIHTMSLAALAVVLLLTPLVSVAQDDGTATSAFSFTPTDDPAQDIADLVEMARAVVMKRSPEGIAIQLALADAYLRQYRQDGEDRPKSILQAQIVALTAARFAPENPQARVMVARTLAAGGREEEAVRQAQKALLLDPGTTEAGDILDDLGARPLSLDDLPIGPTTVRLKAEQARAAGVDVPGDLTESSAGSSSETAGLVMGLGLLAAVFIGVPLAFFLLVVILVVWFIRRRKRRRAA